MNILLLALVPGCFALWPVIGRALTDNFGPASLSLVRWSLSALIVVLIAMRRPTREQWRAPAGHVLRIAILGALGMGFSAYAAFAAARTSLATNIALIYGCPAALVAAWEIAAGRQRPSASLAYGIAACLAGIVLVVTRGHPEAVLHLKFTPGDLWATAGMLAFVVYTVALRRTPRTLTALPQFSVMGAAASLALLPFAVAEVEAGSFMFAAWTLPWMAAAVLVTGIGAFLGYNIALARNGPVLTSASISLTPMYAAGLAVLLIVSRPTTVDHGEVPRSSCP